MKCELCETTRKAGDTLTELVMEGGTEFVQ